jgi:hypothetical protein
VTKAKSAGQIFAIDEIRCRIDAIKAAVEGADIKATS